MVRLISITAIGIVAASTSAFAQTKPASPAAPSSVCARLMGVYEGASKELAANYATSVGDNSAPRATLRAMEDANTLTEAHIALDLMRDNHCPVPKTPPSSVWYLSAALSCATDRLKASVGQNPVSCDRANWKRAEATQ